MASELYKTLEALVSGAIGAEKGPGLVERQLQAKNLVSKDGFGPVELKLVMGSILGASRLYIPDADKREALKQQVEALA